MPFLVAVAVVTLFGCIVAGLDRDAARALIATAHGLLALAVIAAPRTRTATFDTLKRFDLPAGLFAALLVQAAVMSGAFGVGAAAAPYRAEQAMVGLAGLGFCFAAVAGAAGAMGRNRMVGAILWVPLALATLTVIDWFDGRGDFFGMVAPAPGGRVGASFASANEAATAFAFFCIFAAFAAVDELTRRTADAAAPAETLTRRLLLPTASFLASINLLALTGSRAGIAAGIAGLAVYFFFAWRRGQRGRAGPRIVPIAAAGVAALALVSALTSGLGAIRRYLSAPGDRAFYADMTAAATTAWREKPVFGHGLGAYDLLPASVDGAPLDALRWLAEAGVVGLLLLLAALGVFVWRLWRADDHGRRPSRGFALAAGLLTAALAHGAATSALAAPGPASVLAVLLGVAAAYIDPAGAAVRVRESARTKVLS